MNEHKEFRGLFWLPKKKGEDPSRDDYLPGNLIFDPYSNITLELNGSFKDDILKFGQKHNYNIIHGITFDGEHISLINCYEGNEKLTFPGIFTTEIFVNCFFLGILIFDINKIYFKGIKFHIQNLHSWTNIHGFELKEKWSRKRDRINGFKTNYNLPKNIKFFENEDIIISFEFSFRGLTIPSKKLKKINLEQDIYFYLKFKKKLQFDICLNYISHIQNFLIIATQYPQEILKVICIVQSESNKIVFFTKQRTRKEKMEFNNKGMIFSYNDIHNNSNNVFKMYLENFNNIEPIFEQYIWNFYLNNINKELYFLNQIQVLDSLIRFETKKTPKLENSIIEFLNNNNDLAKLLCKDVDKVAKKIISTRHYFSHRWFDQKKRSAPESDVMKLAKIIRVIVEFKFLEIIGIKTDRIIILLTSKYHLSQTNPIIS